MRLPPTLQSTLLYRYSGQLIRSECSRVTHTRRVCTAEQGAWRYGFARKRGITPWQPQTTK